MTLILTRFQPGDELTRKLRPTVLTVYIYLTNHTALQKFLQRLILARSLPILG
jgi:hypothetical protein